MGHKTHSIQKVRTAILSTANKKLREDHTTVTDLLDGKVFSVTRDEYAVLKAGEKTQTEEALIDELILRHQVAAYIQGRHLAKRIPAFSNFLEYLTFKTNRLPHPRKDRHYWKKVLDHLKEKKLLLPEENVRERFLAHTLSHPVSNSRINEENAVIGIPTKNRPESLQKTIESIITNQKKYGRNVPITVVDDSSDHQIKNKNLSVLKDIAKKTEHPLRYMDRSDRVEFARKISLETGVNERITLFALTGCSTKKESAPKWPTGGSARNALLLESAGNCSLQIDDDILIEPRQPLNTTSTLLFSNDHKNDRDLLHFSSFSQVKQYGKPVDIDIVGLFTKHLGKHPLDLLKENKPQPCDLALHWFNYDNIFNEQASIRKIHTGWYGGSCTPHFNPAWFSHTSFYQNFKNENEYSAVSQSSNITYTAHQPNISQSPWLVSADVALDLTSFFPFFSPVQREDDTIFGALLYHLSSNAFSLQKPYLLFHNNERTHYKKEPKLFYLRATQIITSLIHYYVSERQPEKQITSEKKMYDFGCFFKEFASLDNDTFIKRLKEYIKPAFKQQEADVVYTFFKNGNSWNQYKKDMREFGKAAGNIDQLVNSDDFLWDVPGNRTERISLFQEWMSLYGELSLVWPEIIQAAKKLRDKGVNVSTPV